MLEKPEIVREMEEADRLHRPDIFNDTIKRDKNNSEKKIYQDKFELEDDLDDIWFSLWNLI